MAFIRMTRFSPGRVSRKVGVNAEMRPTLEFARRNGTNLSTTTVVQDYFCE